jgi:predicted nucleic acid-binding protein
MASEVFVDTGAWYAVQVPDDRWHTEATAALRALFAQGLTLVTTNLVVGETYSLLRRTHDHAAAFRFVDALEKSARLLRIHVDEATERSAYDLLRRFQDQRFSFVDGTSFAVMRRRKLRVAFAFDVHFATAGFVRIPVDEKEP